MAKFERITAEQALRDAQEEATLLINGYDNEEKWENTRVPGAISFMDYRPQVVDLPKETELIFYCA